MATIRTCLMLAGLLVAVAPLQASDPVGVYAVVQRVVFEPNNSGPATVQIWGAFSIAIPRESPAASSALPTFGGASSGDLYGPVQRGYMYFACPAGRETVCRNEWNDLNRVAGTLAAVGFGGRRMTNGTIRARDARIATADLYPLNIGVVSIAKYPNAYVATSPNRTMYDGLIGALTAAVTAK